MALARGYASLAAEPGDADRWAAIEAEYERTVASARPAADRAARRPRAGRAEAEAAAASAALRTPYVDTLSVLQLELLRLSASGRPPIPRTRRCP